MNAKRFANLFAAAAALITLHAGTAHAQGLFGGYRSYPAYAAPSTTIWPGGSNYGSMTPCANGSCGIRPAGASYSPCPTGNCPLVQPVAGYSTTGCANGNCPTGNCPNGVCGPQCRTICGPNGCQTICPANYSTPSVGWSNAVTPATTALPSLNLDQVNSWNGAGNQFPGNQFTPGPSFNGNANYGVVAPARGPFNGVNAPVSNGYYPASAGTNIMNDPLVRLN